MARKFEKNLHWDGFEFFRTDIDLYSNVDFNNYTNEILEYVAKNNLTIIDATYDPCTLDNIIEILQKENLLHKVILLNGTFEENTKLENVVYFPYGLYWMQYTLKRFNSKNNVLKFNSIWGNPIRRRKYKISCLNRRPDQHRLYTFTKLLRKSYFKTSLVTFAGLSFKDRNYNYTSHDWTYDLLNEQRYSELTDEEKGLIINGYSHNENLNDWGSTSLNLFHDGYYDAYLSLVTETSWKFNFISDKTAKRILNGQLFCFPGSNQAFIDSLRFLKFDCFDDIFNNHFYANASDLYNNIDDLFSLIDRIYDDITCLHLSNYERLKYNQNQFLSGSYLNHTIKKLKHLNIFQSNDLVKGI